MKNLQISQPVTSHKDIIEASRPLSQGLILFALTDFERELFKFSFQLYFSSDFLTIVGIVV